jgi:hypothetical protein
MDITRTTASALYATTMGPERHFSGALVWGMNKKEGHGKEHSILLEENYQFKKNAIFGRYEWVQKSADELGVEDQFGHQVFGLHAIGLGYNRILLQKAGIDLATGIKITGNLPGSALRKTYGDFPVGMQVYLQFRPSLHLH